MEEQSCDEHKQGEQKGTKIMNQRTYGTFDIYIYIYMFHHISTQDSLHIPC